ncbi:MAG: hypothetical protein ACREJ6_11950 [Candidatus Methylomirabilis sp.]
MSRKIRLVGPDGKIEELHVYGAAGRDVHIDQPLSNLLIGYRPQGMAVDRIFPPVPVGKQSDAYFEFDQSEVWRIPDTTRAPGTPAKQVFPKVSSATYFARNYALGTMITIEDRTNADAVLNLRESQSMMLADLLIMDWELRVAQLVTNSTNVSTVLTVKSGGWSNYETSGAFVDIDAAIRAVRAGTGYIPNKIAIGWEAWNALKNNKFIRERIFPAAGGGASPGVATENQIAALFGFDQLVVSGVMRNTAAQNLPISLSDVWGPHALVYYAPDRASLQSPSYAYTFRWNVPGIPSLAVEDLGYDRQRKADMLDVSLYQDEKITGKNFGVWVSSVM